MLRKLLASLGIAVIAAACSVLPASSAVYNTVYNNAAAIVCSDATCPLIQNIQITTITYAGISGAGTYTWFASCPGTPDGAIYVRPALASVGCFVTSGPFLALPRAASVAALSTLTYKVSPPALLVVDSYYANGETGPLFLTWNGSSTATVGPCGPFQAAGLSTGRYELNYAPPINVKQHCGAKGDGTTNDQASVQAAHNASTAVYYPTPGTCYKITSITLPLSAQVIAQTNTDAGQSGAQSGVCNTTTSDWAYKLTASLNANVAGPQFYNMRIMAQGCVQLGNHTLGQPGFGGTQGTIYNAGFHNISCQNNGSAPSGVGIELAACHRCTVDQRSEIIGFNDLVHSYYSEFQTVRDSLLWQYGSHAIVDEPANTFGTNPLYINNDIVGPYTAISSAIKTGGLHATISGNYLECCSMGTTFTAGIEVDGTGSGGPETFSITDNSFSGFGTAFGPNWLKVTTTGSDPTNCVISGNNWTGAGPALFNGGAGIQLQAGGGNYSTCAHFGNTSEAGIPLNSQSAYQASLSVPFNAVANWFPTVPNTVLFRDGGGASYIKNEASVVVPSATPTLVYWTDPTVLRVGSLKMYVLAWADAGQSVTFREQDNFVVPGSGACNLTVTVTTTPTWYNVCGGGATIITNVTFNVSNATADGPNNVYVGQVVITN